MNSYRMIVLAVCCSAFVACAEPLPQGPAKTLKTYPHAADRYARLLRRQLIDPDPVEVQQELACEDWRLSRVLGVDESTLRVVGVRDTVLATVSARAAHVRVQRMVAGRSYEMGGRSAIHSTPSPIARIPSSRSTRPNRRAIRRVD